jgi:hypothetical protein
MGTDTVAVSADVSAGRGACMIWVAQDCSEKSLEAPQLGFQEYCLAEAQFPRIPLVGSWLTKT